MLDLDAGKYAAYVWPAFAITALVFAILVIGAVGHARRWRRRAEDLNLQLGARR